MLPVVVVGRFPRRCSLLVNRLKNSSCTARTTPMTEPRAAENATTDGGACWAPSTPPLPCGKAGGVTHSRSPDPWCGAGMHGHWHRMHSSRHVIPPSSPSAP